MREEVREGTGFWTLSGFKNQEACCEFGTEQKRSSSSKKLCGWGRRRMPKCNTYLDNGQSIGDRKEGELKCHSHKYMMGKGKVH